MGAQDIKKRKKYYAEDERLNVNVIKNAIKQGKKNI
jgi:hypothetical protein